MHLDQMVNVVKININRLFNIKACLEMTLLTQSDKFRGKFKRGRISD